jgi:ribose-phosphate pyrophosphokinase
MSIQIERQDGTMLPFKLIGFAGGERHVQLQDLAPLKSRYLTIRAKITSTDGIMDLLLIENALRNAFGEAVKINLELPYLPYSRQDRVTSPGQAFSLKVMANLLKIMTLNQLVTWDCHSQTGTVLTQAHNVKPASIIQSDPALSSLLKDPKSVLICPDKGAVDRCRVIQETLKLNEIVYCEKQRDPATGKISQTNVLSEDLTGRCAVITDDICDGGYTFIKIAEQLRAKNVERIVLFVTHGIFSKGLDVFDGLIDEVFTTNSLPQQPHPKLCVINFNYTFGEQS